MAHISTRIERIVAGLVLGISFLVMASIIVPHSTQATSNDHAITHPDAIHHPAPTTAHTPSHDTSSTDPHEGLAMIGSIEGSCYLVRIYAGETQPLYTVTDLTDGRELGTLMTAEQTAARFPDLPVTTMDFSADDSSTFAPRIIMLADPAELYDFH